MNAISPSKNALRDRVANFGALAVLLVIGALALVGPSGVLAWGEDSTRLKEYNVRIAHLQEREAMLVNRRRLLNPSGVDEDLASELLHRDLNVAAPDEYVLELGE